MYTVGVVEQSRIPIKIKYVKEPTYTVVINPKYSIIKLRSRIGVVI